LIIILPTTFQLVSKNLIDKGHPSDLWIPAWFPAAAKLICAHNGCEECQEHFDRPRFFELIIDSRSGI